jgi:hypothetical protein
MIGARLQRQQIRPDFKPDFPVRIRSDHPLAGTLNSVTLLDSLNPVDLISGRMEWTVSGVITPSISKSGIAIKGNGSNGYLNRKVSISTFPSKLIIMVFESVGTSAAATAPYTIEGNGGANDVVFGFRVGDGSTRNIRALIRYGVTETPQAAVGPVAANGSIYACAFLARSANQANNFLYVNGSRYTASGPYAGGNYGTLINETVGASNRGPGAVTAFDSNRILLVGHGSAPQPLTDLDDALIEWTQNPWDLFEPERSRATVFFAAAGGGASRTITPSGGVTITGAVDFIRARVQNPAGAILFGGSADIAKSKAFDPAGALTLSGEAPYSRGRQIGPSGGVLFSGEAPITFLGGGGRVISPSGGVAFGGAADYQTHSSVREIVPSGGLQLSGGAPMTLHETIRVIAPSGGAVFGGAAPMTLRESIRNISPSGGVTLSGAAPMTGPSSSEGGGGWTRMRARRTPMSTNN